MFLKYKERFIPIEPCFSIGKDAQNNLKVDDIQVSPRHLQIVKYPHGFRVQNITPNNKMIVNNQEVSSTFLKDGDKITIGKTFLYFTEIKRPPLTSHNEKWSQELSKLHRLSQSELPLLITGPSGSGKEHLTNFIHEVSLRSHQPLVAVNCGALQENLVSSELFGHQKGAFTDAHHNRKGVFELAHKGTLFLDEIGDMPLSIQPQLLRVLENRQVKPLGAHNSIFVDVRVIAATHHNLKTKSHARRIQRGSVLPTFCVRTKSSFLS